MTMHHVVLSLNTVSPRALGSHLPLRPDDAHNDTMIGKAQPTRIEFLRTSYIYAHIRGVYYRHPPLKEPPLGKVLYLRAVKGRKDDLPHLASRFRICAIRRHVATVCNNAFKLVSNKQWIVDFTRSYGCCDDCICKHFCLAGREDRYLRASSTRTGSASKEGPRSERRR